MPEELIGALLLGAYLLVYWLTGHLVPGPRRDRRKDWKDAVDLCGLRIEITTEKYGRLAARGDSFEVQIEKSGNQGRDTRIVIEAPVAKDYEQVSIRPEAASPARDARTGDPGFDDAFSIEGPALQLFALLDADTRRRLCAVNAAGRLEISPGRIEAVISGNEPVVDVLPSLLEIGKRLGTPVDIPRSLVENVKQDFDGEVRLQNLLLLLRELPGDPATVEALRAACRDWSPATRLRAAEALGPEGRGLVFELAQGLEDDSVSAEAVSILDEELPLERVEALLGRAGSSGRLETARACVEALGRREDPAAEASLIQALQQEQPEVRVAAANVLARAGTAAAVLPLKAAAERLPLDRELRHAARQAIAQIQSRVQGASPGQLSLAEAEGGELSLAKTESGELSLAEETSGQLSFDRGEEPAEEL